MLTHFDCAETTCTSGSRDCDDGDPCTCDTCSNLLLGLRIGVLAPERVRAELDEILTALDEILTALQTFSPRVEADTHISGVFFGIPEMRRPTRARVLFETSVGTTSPRRRTRGAPRAE